MHKTFNLEMSQGWPCWEICLFSFVSLLHIFIFSTGQLVNLVTLDVSHNHIEHIPKGQYLEFHSFTIFVSTIFVSTIVQNSITGFRSRHLWHCIALLKFHKQGQHHCEELNKISNVLYYRVTEVCLFYIYKTFSKLQFLKMTALYVTLIYMFIQLWNLVYITNFGLWLKWFLLVETQRIICCVSFSVYFILP